MKTLYEYLLFRNIKFTSEEERRGRIKCHFVLGIVLALLVYFSFSYVADNVFCTYLWKNVALRTIPIVTLAIGALPISYLLWRFRTFDTLKSQELTQETNLIKSLTDAVGWVHKKSPVLQATGLILLARLRKMALADSDLTKRIDNVTHSGLSFKNGTSIIDYEFNEFDISNSKWGEEKKEGVDKDSKQLNSIKDKIFTFKNIEFKNCTVQNADLSEGNFDSVTFSENTSLYQTLLSRSIFSDCHFYNSKIQDANFYKSIFKNFNFVSCNLEYSNFESGIFKFGKFDTIDASISKIDESKDEKYKRKFYKAKFISVTLYNVDFSRNNLSHAIFSQETIIKKVKFIGTILNYADFSKATFEQPSDFSHANIKGAKFPYASRDDAIAQHPTLKKASGEPIYIGSQSN